MTTRRPALALLALLSGLALFGACAEAPPPPPAAPTASAPPPPPPPACESTAACLPKCEAGDNESCRRFSDMVSRHRGPSGDPARALKIFEPLCEQGVLEACNAAALLLHSRRDRAERARAVALWKKSCEGGNPDGCVDLVDAEDHHDESALATLQGACDKGWLPACKRVGEMYEWGETGEADLAKAEAAYAVVREKGQAACEGGDSSACVAMGNLLAVQHGGIQDSPRAAALLQKGCDLGDLEACEGAAFQFSEGPGARDEKRAAEDFARLFEARKQGCEMGSIADCDRLATAYLHGQGTTKDPAKALEIRRQSCEKGHAPSCAAASLQLRSGNGVPKDPDKAAELQTLACTNATPQQREQCAAGARMFEQGRGLPRDEAKAASLYKAGCELGDRGACLSLARITQQGRGVAKDPAAALELLKKTCEGRMPEACAQAARMLADGNGVPRDRASALPLAKKACDGGATAGCVYEGLLLEKGEGGAKDQAAAEAAWKRGCDRSNGSSCFYLASAMEHPAKKGDKPDLKAVAGLYEKACRLGERRACSPRAALDESGKIGAKDPKHALEMTKQACRSGLAEACVKGRGKAAQLLDPDDKHLARVLARDPEVCKHLSPSGSSPLDQSACLRAAYLADQGLAVEGDKLVQKPKDPAAAAELYRAGCEAGSVIACGQHGYLMAHDKKASAADRQAGVEMLRRACFLGHDFACARLKELREKP